MGDGGERGERVGEIRLGGGIGVGAAQATALRKGKGTEDEHVQGGRSAGLGNGSICGGMIEGLVGT